jgi:hypothetical protein
MAQWAKDGLVNMVDGCVLILLYMCPHTIIYVSSYYFMCPHTPTYVSSYYYICVCMAQWAKDGLVNMVGGCCGTTPDHIKLFAEQCALITEVRKVPEHPKYMRLSGLRLNRALIAP